MGALVRFAIALSTLVGTLAAPTTKSTADLPDFELGSGKLAPRQDYTYNWTGIDNHVNFQPTSNGYSVTFSYASTDPSTVSEFFVGRGWSRGANRYLVPRVHIYSMRDSSGSIY
jgi:hypothetical protein